MSRAVRFALCILQAVICVNAIGHYTVVGPGTIRSGFKYNVAVSVHKADGPCQIKVGITGPSYNETKLVDIAPMATKSIEFDVPKLENGDYNLTAVGVSGIVFENSTKLNYANYQHTTFIQTDKATYKPGDLVQFRVVFLDENTRPAHLERPVSIVIDDGSQNRIKQWKDVQLTRGVYSGQLQLSEQPVLGNWNIKVLDGENTETKVFEVAKYVLPKFDVAIETAKDVAIPDNKIKVTVRSKYTYGKAVKGKATISLKRAYDYFYSATENADAMQAEKTIDVDGKGHVEFDLVNDLHITNTRSYIPPLKIVAVMEEELTGNKQNATTTVTLHSESYRIEGIDSPYTYLPGKPIVFKVVVKHHDGTPVHDTKTIAKLLVDPPRRYFQRGLVPASVDPSISTTTERPEEEKTLTFESKLDEHGMAKFEFTLPESNHSFYSVKCEFGDSTGYLSSLSKFTPPAETFELLKFNVNTKEPRLGKDVSVEIKSREPLTYFVYTIAARGKILKAEHVDVPEGRRSHTIKFTPTFDMVPRTSLYIHFVHDNNLRFEEIVIDLKKDFENSIDITSTAQAKPGEDVKLKIKTDPDSFVGLLGVDQSVLLLKSGNDFGRDEIFNSLSSFDSTTPWQRGYGRYPGQTSGLVTMTNANYPYNDAPPFLYRPLASSAFGGGVLMFQSPGLPGPPGMPSPAGLSPIAPMAHGSRPEPPQIRKEFPENWIFQNIETTENDGFTLAKKIPDTITSWVITGFSLNPKTGFALTDAPTKIKVFQPFFVSTNLPYSVKRGEVIAIPVIIFNYMDKALDAEVTMDNIDKEYEFTEATNEVEENPIDVVKRVKRVSIPSNTGRSVSFMIRPKKVGQITLKITAVTPLAGDAIHQMLKVEPEGVTQFINRAVFLNLKNKPEHSEQLTVDVPPEAVPDSEYVEFAVVGDLLGPTIQNLDKLVRMPYGCGEQNMVNFVPNILVLKYFETIGQTSMPTIVEKAKKFLEIGYQRQLTYKHDDGSYSAFGKSDKAGSTWLTAYVARSFLQAEKYTDIDPKVVKEALDFLATKQAANGSFPEYGKLFDSSHQNELGLTSFVLLAFMEREENIQTYSVNVEKGLKFVLENAEKEKDLYSLAIAALALQRANNPMVEKILTKVQGQAKQEGERKWWSKATDEPATDLPRWYYRPRSNDVEITSYVLLALLHKESAETVLPIIKWLISQRNSNGGFSSTQDTVVGLQALIRFAELTGSGSGSMDISFVATGGTETKGNIKVTPDTSLLLQTHVLPQTTRQVDFTAKGTGASMVQLAYRYNLAEKDKKPSFQVKTTVRDDTPPSQLIVEICSEYVPLEDNNTKKESNMAVLEIALPSGYTADTDSFDKIQAVDRVKRTETKNSESTVIVYFDGLEKGAVKCVPVHATRTHAVAKQKPASVMLYDYYDSAQRATEYYGIKSSLCDICEGADCGSGCQK